MPKIVPVPQMQRHSRSGKAFVSVYDENRRRRQVTLGKWGSTESQRAYADVLAKLATDGGAALLLEDRAHVEANAAPEVTVAGLAARFMTWADGYYRSPVDGEPTREPSILELACAPLLRLFGDTPARELGVAELRRVRESMIAPGDDCRALVRQTVNNRINQIRRLFRWAAENGFVDPGTWHNLKALSPIRFGRDRRLRETAPRRPVAESVVEATLPHLPPMLADVARLQLLIGCRPGEILRACSREFDRSGEVWLFAPTRAKMGYRRKVAPYACGPKAQQIIARYLRLDPETPMFQPAESERARTGMRRAARATKLWPSHVEHIEGKRAEVPKRKPGDVYDTSAFARAVRRAAAKAQVESWSPHQLRHLAATLARKRAGAEVARVVLSHSDINATQIYAEADLTVATAYARAHG